MKKTIISTLVSSLFFTSYLAHPTNSNDINSLDSDYLLSLPIDQTQYQKGFDEFLGTMRKTRDNIIASSTNQQLIQNIKQGLARDGHWTINTRQNYILLKERVLRSFYYAYSSDKPKVLQPLTQEESENVYRVLSDINRSADNFRINVQGFNESSIANVNQNDFIRYATSARFIPETFYTEPEVDTLFTSRLTLNFSKQYLPQIIDAFSKLYSGDVADVVRQAKILAPAKFGSLTDQAVLYLNGASIDNAQRVVAFLAQHVPQQAWVEHTPLGMVALAKGQNYAESSRIAFPSHGGSRAVVATDAILENIFSGESLGVLLPETLSKHGYDSARIPLLDPSFEYKSKQAELSEAILDFTRDPQSFLKSFTLDATSLMSQHAALQGEPIMHIGTDGYQLNISKDDGLASNRLRVLSEPLLDNMPSFIDVKKTAKYGEIVVAAANNGGTAVVVDHDPSHYRIYFDKRPHAYALYDNVVALRDLSSGYRVGENIKFDKGLDVTFFVYNDKGWQSLVQKQSFNSFSDLEVRRIGSTTAVPFAPVGDNLEQAFVENRTAIQAQLISLADRLGISTANVTDLPYNPAEIKQVDTHSSLKMWNDLRTALSRKVSAQRQSLARNRILELAKLKIPGYPNKASVKQKLSLLRASLLELDTNTQGLIDLSRDADQMWLNVKQKQEQGTAGLIVADENLRAGNFDKTQIHHQFLVKERAIRNLTGSKRTAFDDGYENYRSIELPDFDESMSLSQRQLLLLGSTEMDARQQGALIRWINEQMNKEQLSQALGLTAKFNEQMKRLGGTVVTSIPQDFVLTLMGDGSGRCYPLVRAMSVAMTKGTESVRHLSNKLFIGAADPSAVESQFLLDALHNLHASHEARQSSQTVGSMDINGIAALLDRSLSSKGRASFAVNTSVHSVGLSAVNDMGTKRFYFYDPNFSVVEFNSLKSLRKGLEAHFIMNGWADYYMAAGTQAKPEFNVINIDTDKMARVRVLPGRQVIDLTIEYPLSPVGDGDSIVTISDDESIVTIDDDESSVSTSESIMTIDDDESIMVLESSEQQIEQDLSLRMSLTKVAAYDHARKLSSAISKARTLYSIPDDWLPVIGSITQPKEGFSAITFMSPDQTEESRVQLRGLELIKVSEYLREQFSKINTRFDLRTGRPVQSLGFEDVQGFDGLNAGFAVQSVITWFQNEQRNQVADQSRDSLQRALQIHSYVMAGQIAHGLLNDASHMVELFRVAAATDTELVNVTMNSISGIANQGIGLAFGVVNVGLSSYELAHAKNAQQKAIFGTQLGFNAVGTALGGAALGAGIAGSSTAAIVLGEAGAIVGGLAVGFTALAEAFGNIAQDAQQVGHYFYQVDQAYQNGGYRYDADNDILVPLPGAVVDRIDLSRGEIELGSQALYSSKHGKTGSGWLNYFFWAGDLPKALRDKSKALPIRERLGYAANYPINSNSSKILLPATGFSYIDYDYEILPGSTTRHDQGFDVLRSLETQLDFDFDFYVFPSEYVIRHMKEEFVDHTVEVNLGSDDRIVFAPKLAKFGHRKLHYRLSAQGGNQELVVQPQGRYTLVEEPGERVDWIIDAREIKGADIRLEANKLVIGSVSFDLVALQNSTLTIYIDNGEVWQVIDDSLSLLQLDVDKENTADGVRHHLEQMAAQHQLLGDYVVVENYQEDQQLFGRAYYDVKQDRMIATKNVSAELSYSAQLLTDSGESALVFNAHYGQLWKTDIATGKMTEFYSLHQPSEQAISAEFNAWTEAESVLVAATYHMPDQSKIKYLYRLTSSGLKLNDIHGDGQLYQSLRDSLSQGHRQLIDSSMRSMPPLFIGLDQGKQVPAELSDIVEVGKVSQTPVWSILSKEQIVNVGLSRAAEDLKLLLVNKDTYYFYTQGQQSIVILNETGLTKLSLSQEDKVSAHDGVYVVKPNGEIHVVTDKGTLNIVAFNRQWLEEHSQTWQDKLGARLKGIAHQVMIFGLTDYDSKPLKAWYLPSTEQFILLSKQWQDTALKLVGARDKESVWLFDPATGKAYTQQTLNKEQMYNFTPDFRFITDGLITTPEEMELTREALANFYVSHDGYRVTTLSGLEFEISANTSVNLTKITQKWLYNGQNDLESILDTYPTRPLIQLGDEGRWLVAQTGQQIQLAHQGEAIWIGSTDDVEPKQVFFIPENGELVRSDRESGSVSLGFYDDVFRNQHVWTLVLKPTQSGMTQVVKLADVDTLVLATSGRSNSYALSDTVGQYKTVIIQDSGYLTAIDLSDFAYSQVVAQHEQDRLKLVIDGKTLIMMDSVLNSSKNKLSLRFSGDSQPRRILSVLNKLDAYCLDGVNKLSDLLN
ncbi:TcdA/TcdB pore-forming domain-containing protein [Vibrio tetraodonis]|uniref:TcdA/TcdB pore-forming domain-containing protein n=1 Tax=Vibrio tetraodonis TaxID=2231647 RepID=UPI001F0809A7|nr:TcdA/TcdB pore-forming domain-containing protein [Vibrio tetraodonis]